MKSVCPQCGSDETQRRLGAERVCRACGTRFIPFTPLWERSIFALVFLVLGLVFGIITVAIYLIASGPAARQNAVVELLVCCGVVGWLALVCCIAGIRELTRQAQIPSKGSGDDFPELNQEIRAPRGGQSARQGRHSQFGPRVSPLVPQEVAEALVREIAEKHGAKRILRSLGNLPQDHVDNAAAHFAQQMEDDETPLALIDTSFLGNGKAGFLLTNRGLYSSFCSRPFWLADIDNVSYATPGFGDYAVLWLLAGGTVFFQFGFGGDLGHVAKFLPALVLGTYIFSNFRQFQTRLLVNGKRVYAGNKRLLGAFWIELLTKLTQAARQTPATAESGKRKPCLVVLEIAQRIQEDEAVEVRPLRDPSWPELEQSIRALDQNSHPSLRIWSGEVEQAPALDILGGNGKYVLRELGDGWTYYDPSAGEEEVEVCTGIPGHRAPAFYVCTNLERVLEVARHYVETGSPE